MKRAVILDRDGVINDNRQSPNVNRPQDLVLFPFTAEAIRLLNDHNFLVLVATNQGGVGLHYMTEEMLTRIHDTMLEDLKAQNAVIHDIAACTHPPRAGCDCRKPKPGLLFQLQSAHHFDLNASYMVGDRQSDIDAGNTAGASTVFVLSGAESSARGADYVCADLLEAAKWIVDDAAQSPSS